MTLPQASSSQASNSGVDGGFIDWTCLVHAADTVRQPHLACTGPVTPYATAFSAGCAQVLGSGGYAKENLRKALIEASEVGLTRAR